MKDKKRILHQRCNGGIFCIIIASDYSSLLHKTSLRTFHKVLFKLTMQVNHHYYILTQIDRGIEILKSLNDLEEVKHPMWKLTKDQEYLMKMIYLY